MKELGFDRTKTSNIFDYLRGEGLVESMTLGGGIKITHYWVLEIEAAHENPEEPTEHFLPVNVINIGNMSNSSIQQGNQNSTQNTYFNSTQKQDLESLISKIDELTKKIENAGVKNEVIADNETLKAQIKSPKPKNNVIKETLKSLKSAMTNIASKALQTEINEVIESL